MVVVVCVCTACGRWTCQVEGWKEASDCALSSNYLGNALTKVGQTFRHGRELGAVRAFQARYKNTCSLPAYSGKFCGRW
eukprot:5529498-Amphidinium_carterae.1